MLLDFNWPKKEFYPSFLEIELTFTPKSDIIIDRHHISRAPWERELGLKSYESIESMIDKLTERKTDSMNNDPISRK